MIEHKYRRGEIYYTDFGEGLGSEQRGHRPAVIISNDVGNRNSTTVIVAAITTQRPTKARLPTHVYVGTETGLDSPSIIMLEQIRTISKDRLNGYIGQLSQAQLETLWNSLAVSFGVADKRGNEKPREGERRWTLQRTQDVEES